MIETHDLHVNLGGRPVLQGVNAAWAVGWTAVVGPNGAGKSTLLRALAGLLPSGSHRGAGEVLLEGRPVQSWPPLDRARRLAWLSQQGEVAGDLTVRDVVMLGRLPHLGLLGQPGAADEAAVDEALQAVAASAWASRLLRTLSGGERQRVLLARTLAVQAPILLLDEPTAHLDPPHQVALIRLMRRRSSAHTVVSVLHDLNLALRADRLLILQAGRVVAEGTRDDPRVHRALEAVFDQALQLQRVGADWMAVPRVEA